jgi:hypothetical protein
VKSPDEFVAPGQQLAFPSRRFFGRIFATARTDGVGARLTFREIGPQDPPLAGRDSHR